MAVDMAGVLGMVQITFISISGSTSISALAVLGQCLFMAFPCSDSGLEISPCKSGTLSQTYVQEEMLTAWARPLPGYGNLEGMNPMGLFTHL